MASLLDALTGLKEEERLEGADLHVQGDSDLVVKFLTGRAVTRKQHLATMVQEIKALKLPFRISYQHIPRNRNQLADYLANKALSTQKTRFQTEAEIRDWYVGATPPCNVWTGKEIAPHVRDIVAQEYIEDM